MPAFNDFLKSRLNRPPEKAAPSMQQPSRPNKWQIQQRWLFLGLCAVLSLLVLSWTCNLVLRIMLQFSRWERNRVAEEVSALDGGRFGKLESKDLKMAAANDLQTDYHLAEVLGPEITQLSDQIDRLGRELHDLRDKVHRLNASRSKNQSVPETKSTVSKDLVPSPPLEPVGPSSTNQNRAGT